MRYVGLTVPEGQIVRLCYTHVGFAVVHLCKLGLVLAIGLDSLTSDVGCEKPVLLLEL